jgi:N-acyl amino acid synthase of PEP-CTERM/exosortase system
MEAGFISPQSHPCKLEKDDYDQYSAHFGVYNLFNELIGTTRLILTNPFDFPIRNRCMIEKSVAAPEAEIVEVSRFAISRKYRRRRNDGLTGIESYKGPNRIDHRIRPEIAFFLYREMLAYSQKNQISFWYASMESSLFRLLKRFGFIFEQIGSESDYWGPVYPYLLNIHKTLNHLFIHNNQLYHFLIDQT